MKHEGHQRQHRIRPLDPILNQLYPFHMFE